MDKIVKNVIIFAGIILVIAAGFTAFMLSRNNSDVKGSSNLGNDDISNVDSDGSDDAVPSGEIQNVKLTVSGGTYILNPSTLKKGVPVRMEVDLNTVRGCARDIVIAPFGVRKYVKQGDNIITFTPTQTGTIKIACSMNMYRGTFTVE